MFKKYSKMVKTKLFRYKHHKQNPANEQSPCPKLLHRGRSKGAEGGKKQSIKWANSKVEEGKKRNQWSKKAKHCVRTTIKSYPSVSKRPAPENIAAATSHIEAVEIHRAAAGGLLPASWNTALWLRKWCNFNKWNIKRVTLSELIWCFSE